MKSVAILGYGGRGRNYSMIVKYNSKNLKVVACCEHNSEKLEIAKKELSLANDRCFSNTDDFFKAGKVADYVFICTQDADHYEHTMKALDVGYSILLEKPISPSLEECLEIEKKALEKNQKIYVCHV